MSFIERRRIDAPAAGETHHVILGRMQDQLAAGVALALAHTAQLEQLEAEAALLLARAPLVPDDALVGDGKGAHEAAVLHPRPGVVVDRRVAEEVLDLVEAAAEIDEQRRTFVDKAAADGMRQRQADDEGPAAHRGRNEDVSWRRANRRRRCRHRNSSCKAGIIEAQRLEHRLRLIAADSEPRHAAAEGAGTVGARFEHDALVDAAPGEPESRRNGQSNHADDGSDHGAPASLPASVLCCRSSAGRKVGHARPWGKAGPGATARTEARR